MATEHDGVVTVCCSWCHAAVVVRERRQYCESCGHRADVARADCDCPKCWKPVDGEPEPGLPDDEALADMIESGLRRGENVDELIDALISARSDQP